MAQQKKRAPARRKKRHWLIPKILLVCAYGVVIAFLGTIFVMRKELRRLGVFGNERAAVSPASPSQALPVPSPEMARQGETASPVSPTAEVTQEEKKQLEDILRARSGK